ncbi:MAG TPA: GNAT family N-acetyltransferase [Bacilli bacterium]|nr:GNAT family N-acetyltransferase [Bacilli bacterium]
MLLDAAVIDVPEYIERFAVDKSDEADELDVEVYLKELALMHHRQRTTHTRLFFNDTGELIGYFSVLADLLKVGKGKRADRQWDLDSQTDIFPAIKIHYIGVDVRYRKQGYGALLLAEAILLCKDVADKMGCNFITVEAKQSAVGFFRKYGFDYCARDPYSALVVKGNNTNLCLNIRDLAAVVEEPKLEETA